jgi:hypothetical protein
MPTLRRRTYGYEPFLDPRMCGIRKDRERPVKHSLDFCDRNAMPATFAAIPVIPLEAGNAQVHALRYLCTYKCQSATQSQKA